MNLTDNYTVRNDLKECFRRNYHIPLICAVTHIVMILLSSDNSSYYDYQPMYGLFGALLPVCQAIYVLYGILFGIKSFSFLLNKNQMNVYLSLPITRKALLKNRVITGVVYSFLASAVPMLFSLILNAVFFKVDLYLIKVLCILTVGMFAAILLGFGLSSLFAVYSGKTVEAVLYSLLILILPTAFHLSFCSIASLINGIMIDETIFGGMYQFSYDSYYGTVFINPVYNMFGLIDTVAFENTKLNLNVTTGGRSVVFVNLLISVVPFLFLPRLIKKRKAEKNEFSCKNKYVAFVISFIAAFLCFSFVNVFYDLNNAATVVSASIIISLAVFMLIPTIIFRKKSKIKEFMKFLPAVFGVFGIIYLVCLSGIFGYFNRVPDVNEIESCYLMPVCNDEFLSAKDELLENQDIVYGPFTAEADIEKITSIHASATQNLGKGEETVFVGYKLKNGKAVGRYYHGVTQEAALETLSFVETEWYQNLIESILDSELFRVQKTKFNTLCEIDDRFRTEDWFSFTQETLTWEQQHELSLLYNIMEFDYNPALLNNSVSDGFFLSDKLTKAEIEQFKKCLIKDYEGITAEKMFFPTERAEYILRFDEDTETDWWEEEEIKVSNPADYDSYYTGAELAIYPWMKNTMDFIEKHSLTIKHILPSEVEYIKVVTTEKAVENYRINEITDGLEVRTPDKQIFVNYYQQSYSDGLTAFRNSKQITDKSVIEEYLNSFQSSYCYLGHEGEIVQFMLEHNSYFYAFVPKK